MTWAEKDLSNSQSSGKCSNEFEGWTKVDKYGKISHMVTNNTQTIVNHS